VLTEDGRPKATIVLAAAPSQSAWMAAMELQTHVQKITGAKLPIVSDERAVEGARVLVGDSRATAALKLSGASLDREEYVVRLLPDALVLLGRDADDPQQAATTPRFEPGKFGRAARFDGCRTVVLVPESGFDDARGSWEARVWLPTAVPEKHGTILRIDGHGHHILQRDAGTSVISYTSHDGARSQVVRSAPLAEGWHHVLGTWDAAASTLALHVDGKLCGTSQYTKTACRGAPVGIGGLAYGGTNPVPNGWIAWASSWRRASSGAGSVV
jgi:hypothetical protein